MIRFPVASDEEILRIAHQELELDGSNFLLDGFENDMNFDSWLKRVENSAAGVDLEPGRVASTFWILEIDNQIVGRVSIRHELNEWLSNYGGHIGYAVRPGFRGRGHAKQLLAAGLSKCDELGITEALLTCNDDNLASAAVIESAGGVLQNKILDGDKLLRRYLVPTL